jgi:predicted nucleic acid-binding protein
MTSPPPDRAGTPLSSDRRPMSYLADTSLVVRLRRGRQVAATWLDAVRAGLVGVCPPVEAELVRAVASRQDRDELTRQIHSLFAWWPVPDHAWRIVARTQESLLGVGKHKGPSIVDLLVAATAETWNLTILHVDADFETIASVAPVRTQRADRG